MWGDVDRDPEIELAPARQWSGGRRIASSTLTRTLFSFGYHPKAPVGPIFVRFFPLRLIGGIVPWNEWIEPLHLDRADPATDVALLAKPRPGVPRPQQIGDLLGHLDSFTFQILDGLARSAH